MNWAWENRDQLDKTHYTVLSSSESGNKEQQYFINLYPSVLEAKRDASGGQFDVIVIGNIEVVWDYFDIPFNAVADLLTSATLTKGEKRWLIQIINERFTVFPGGEGTSVSIPVGEYYRCHHLPDGYV